MFMLTRLEIMAVSFVWEGFWLFEMILKIVEIVQVGYLLNKVLYLDHNSEMILSLATNSAHYWWKCPKYDFLFILIDWRIWADRNQINLNIINTKKMLVWNFRFYLLVVCKNKIFSFIKGSIFKINEAVQRYYLF